jgi:hypothetical protein
VIFVKRGNGSRTDRLIECGRAPRDIDPNLAVALKDSISFGYNVVALADEPLALEDSIPHALAGAEGTAIELAQGEF